MNAAEFKEAVLALPRVSNTPPPIYTWDRHRWEIRLHLENNASPNDILEWSTMTATMVVGEAPYIEEELGALMAMNPWRWGAAIQDSGFGGSIPLSYAPYTSGNMVHQAYHLLNFELAASKHIDEFESIVEIGGGYGSLALICRRLGFTGQYTILDFPEFSLVQQFYLSNVGVNDVTFNQFPHNADLLMACWSVSEMSLEERAKFLEIEANNYLLAFQPVWRSIDNVKWFNEWAKPEYTWRNAQACRENLYLFGYHGN